MEYEELSSEEVHMFTRDICEMDEKELRDLIFEAFKRSPECFRHSEKIAVGKVRSIYKKHFNKVTAIKEYKALSGVGLKEAKDFVEYHCADLIEEARQFDRF